MTNDKLDDLLYKYRQLIRQEREREVLNGERFEVEAQFTQLEYDMVMEIVGPDLELLESDDHEQWVINQFKAGIRLKAKELLNG